MQSVLDGGVDGRSRNFPLGLDGFEFADLSRDERLQSLLGAADNTRIIILPVDAALPRPTDEDEEGKKRKATATTREEHCNE